MRAVDRQIEYVRMHQAALYAFRQHIEADRKRGHSMGELRRLRRMSKKTSAELDFWSTLLGYLLDEKENLDRYDRQAQMEADIREKVLDTERLQNYLDNAIRMWRKKRGEYPIGEPENIRMAEHYIDAFQSVRASVFGATLPVSVEEGGEG